MKPLFTVALVLFLFSIIGNGAGKKAPFQIPPHGKPEQLLGSVDLEATTFMAFDSLNRPYLLNSSSPESFGKIRTVRDGKWVTLSVSHLFEAGALPTERDIKRSGTIVIDDRDCIYLLLAGKLIYSSDLGESFKAYPCEGSLELRVGMYPFLYPPAIGIVSDSQYVDRIGEREEHMAWWAKRGTLFIYLPKKKNRGLEIGEPVLITEDCSTAGSGGHSGGTSFAVTLGDRTHVVYAETPKDVRTGGNPIHLATVDRKTRTVIARQFLVNAPPHDSDVHTRPTITADSEGYLHVLSGSHNQPFFYMRSLKPNDITGGWTQPEQLPVNQCYASIVCDNEDRLHSVFRGLPHNRLEYSRAEPGSYQWGQAKTLALGEEHYYSIFYHRVFIDRKSNLYVRFTFYEPVTELNGDYPDALIISSDGGKTWRLAGKKTFLNHIAAGNNEEEESSANPFTDTGECDQEQKTNKYSFAPSRGLSTGPFSSRGSASEWSSHRSLTSLKIFESDDSRLKYSGQKGSK